MRHALVTIVVAALIVAWIEPTADGKEPWQGASASWSTPDPVPVAHSLPEPVVRAIQYLDMEEKYLGLDAPAYPVELNAAIEQRPTKSARISSSYKRPAPNYVAPAEIEALVAAYFKPEDVQQAINIIFCESRFDANAKNPRSTASGLFQHLEGWWSGAWGVTGSFDPFDPEQSIKAGAALAYNTKSGWSNWNPSRHCWG